MALLRQRALAAGLSASPGDSRRPSSSGNGPSFPALSTSNGPAVPAQAASVTGANDATPFVPTVSPEGPWGLAPVPEMRGGVVSAEAYHPSHGHPAGGLTDWARVGLEPVEPAGPSPVGYVPPGAHARGGVSSGVPVQNGGPRVGSVSPTARGVVSGDGREKGKRGKGPAANGGASGRYIDMLRTLQEARAPAQASGCGTWCERANGEGDVAPRYEGSGTDRYLWLLPLHFKDTQASLGSLFLPCFHLS